jgi:23S rRNA (uracil1939-C5)-methyltransferase
MVSAPDRGERVRILRLAAGGDGVGRLADGRTVFGPRTAPGDLVELTGERPAARFVRARAGDLLEAGAARVTPRCRHYVADDCGGCQFQHLEYAAQLEAKRVILADALSRIGRLTVAVPPVVGAGDPWRYRTRITLAIGPGRRLAGFHPHDQPARVFDLERCEIAVPPLMALWAALRPALHRLPQDASHLVLRLDRDGGLHVIVRARGHRAWTGGRRLADDLAARGTSATVWWHPEGGAPRVVSGERELFPVTVFEQVHPDLGDRVRYWAIERLAPGATDHAWDLYAGIGETTVALSAAGATVESVESDRRAVEFAEARSRTRYAGTASTPGPGVTRHLGRVEDVVGALRDPSLVIANPPRAGIDPGVLDVLILRRPRRIAYISCDPATLARDLARLCSAGGGPGAGPPYRLCAVQPFDLFPQTAHVETVGMLELA